MTFSLNNRRKGLQRKWLKKAQNNKINKGEGSL